jgi:hypothetical protein
MTCRRLKREKIKKERKKKEGDGSQEDLEK